MEDGQVDEAMRLNFLEHAESLDPKFWEGHRWGIKTAYMHVKQLPYDDFVRQVLGALEGNSEMSKRRQRWCEEYKAEKKKKNPLSVIKKMLKSEDSGPDPA